MTWVLAASLSALFVGLTSILSKLGVRTVDSDAATALRTGVVLLLAWAVALASGPASGVVPIDKLSILVSLLFARFVLKERLAPRGVFGLVLVLAATLVLAIR